jgi:hypothetical protein
VGLFLEVIQNLCPALHVSTYARLSKSREVKGSTVEVRS